MGSVRMSSCSCNTEHGETGPDLISEGRCACDCGDFEFDGPGDCDCGDGEWILSDSLQTIRIENDSPYRAPQIVKTNLLRIADALEQIAASLERTEADVLHGLRR
jgi:hypothetical protein